MNETHSQAFRARSSSEVITIPTRQEPGSCKRVVRWKDIHQYFNGAVGILNGQEAVLFLTNRNFEDLIPLRIAHHPGVVLEVLVPENTLGYSAPINTLETTSRSGDHQTQPPEQLTSAHVSSSHLPVALPAYTPASNNNHTICDDSFVQPSEKVSNMSQEEQLQKLNQRTQEIHLHLEQQINEIRQSTQQLQEWMVGGGRRNHTSQDSTRPYSSSVCIEDQYERALRHLKDTVDAMYGTLSERPGKIDIRVNSDSVTNRLYDAIVDLSTIQFITKKPSFTVDCGRFTLTSDSSPEGRDTSVTIKRLGDFTVDDLDFIQLWDPTQLSIRYTPQETDEGRLTNILQQCHRLKELCIGCLGERALAIIKLVVSTREKTLQDGGLSTLQTLQLIDEELVLFNLYEGWDHLDHITTTLTFSNGSTKFAMDTRIKLQFGTTVTESDWTLDYFRQYGWSISCLATTSVSNDHLAELLDSATQTHGSRIRKLDYTPYLLTDTGLDAMDRVIKRSQSLAFLGLYLVGLEKEHQRMRIAPLLRRHGAKLNKLHLTGDAVESWLPQVAQNFSWRDFPTLEDLVVRCYQKLSFPRECIRWLVEMVSRLRKFRLSNITLSSQDWETLITAIDFDRLEWLTIDGTNFSQAQLDLLMGHITTTTLSLERVDITGTDLLIRGGDKDALRARIRKVAPRATILGL
ncbi:hypothetical protein B0O80DRAFT_495915 [Mortierella sp. GBAus27b]|nr:hypothetical protein BGX31_005007 [Mortierella sp. GBA43]KAI8358143.1 hypothetical protein B0O80DRAFT_495915 [Mortierella sp. GBAus27b]